MTLTDAYIPCSAKRPRKALQCLVQWGAVIFLSTFVHSVNAEENPYDLPDIGYDQIYSGSLFQHQDQNLESATSYLKNLTRKQLTDHSGIYLSPKGVILETEHSDNIATEFKAEGDGEITFTFSLSF